MLANEGTIKAIVEDVKKFVSGIVDTLTSSINSKLDKSGGTMTGGIHFGEESESMIANISMGNPTDGYSSSMDDSSFQSTYIDTENKTTDTISMHPKYGYWHSHSNDADRTSQKTVYQYSKITNNNKDLLLPEEAGTLARKEDLPNLEDYLTKDGGELNVGKSLVVKSQIQTGQGRYIYKYGTLAPDGLESRGEAFGSIFKNKLTPNGFEHSNPAGSYSNTLPNKDGTLALQSDVDAINDNLEVLGKCKNLLNPILETTTQNGVTCTNNGDGTYTLNGTATNNSGDLVVFWLENTQKFKAGTYKLLGAPNNTTASIGGNIHGHVEYEGVTVSSDSEISGDVAIVIPNGLSCENLVFKPMLTTNLNATYDDFVPYTGDGETLTHDVAKIKNNPVLEYVGTVQGGATNSVTIDFTNYKEGIYLLLSSYSNKGSDYSTFGIVVKNDDFLTSADKNITISEMTATIPASGWHSICRINRLNFKFS